jgi:hypothetical protein
MANVVTKLLPKSTVCCLSSAFVGAAGQRQVLSISRIEPTMAFLQRE